MHTHVASSFFRLDPSRIYLHACGAPPLLNNNAAHLDVTADQLLWRHCGPVDRHVVRDAASSLGRRGQQRQPVAAGVVLPQALFKGVEHSLKLFWVWEMCVKESEGLSERASV